MTTALVISRFFPYSSERVHGLYQRLGAQIEALAKVVDHINCLFLVPVDQRYTPEEFHRHEARLQNLWSPALSLHLTPSVVEQIPQGLWSRVGEGVFDFQAQVMARPANNAESLAAVSAALDARPDVVLMHRMSAMSVLLQMRREAPEKLRGIPVFFDMDDIEHIAFFRRLVRDPGWPAERVLLMQLPRLVMAEVEAMRMAAGTFVCSEPDRRYLSRFPGGGRVRAIPNSVNFPALEQTDQTEQLVLLVGAMGYRPNAQAADMLVQKIWPLVRAQVPGARLAIVGVGREQTVSYHSPQEGVTFTGFVDDLQPLYRRARVVCCPILHGGGTRVKIIEAAAHAKAVISTRVGAEGLDFRDRQEIILEDDAAAIAQACVRLLGDPAAASRIGQAALAKARQTYERGVVVSQLAGTFRSGMAAGAGRLQ